MASTFSDRLKLELMATGANANTWGTNTNNNLEVLDAFAAGYLAKSVAGSANITLSTANASDTAEASNKVIELTGALTGDIVVFIPAVESNYTFFNNTTGSQTLTIAATGHTANGTQITQGAHTTVYCDGSSDFNVEIASSTDAGALNKGTLPDARFPATLPAVSGANLTNLDAADLASGTIPDARFPATLPALNGSALTDLNATALASGTVNNARLDTVPTTKGGTGLTSLGSAGQAIVVNSGASALEFGTIEGGGGYNVQFFENPGTYTPTSGMKNVKVTVLGGGGGAPGASGAGDPGAPGHSHGGGGGGAGGLAIEELSAAQVGASQPVTVGAAGNPGNNGANSSNPGGAGGTSSFGSLLSATGGGAGGHARGQVSGGSGGAGSGGDINISGSPGYGGQNSPERSGADSLLFGVGGFRNGSNNVGNAGNGFGSGGGGVTHFGGGPAPGNGGGAGAKGLVIVEEFL
tara:strand:+ start:480 stop:1883 length:1404 start_codon:yes stop_codon:yes gene_type:complete